MDPQVTAMDTKGARNVDAGRGPVGAVRLKHSAQDVDTFSVIPCTRRRGDGASSFELPTAETG
jgi:hypothetical protein